MEHRVGRVAAERLVETEVRSESRRSPRVLARAGRRADGTHPARHPPRRGPTRSAGAGSRVLAAKSPRTARAAALSPQVSSSRRTVSWRMSRVEPRRRITVSIGSSDALAGGSTATSAGVPSKPAAVRHRSTAATSARSPSRCAAVMSGNSIGARETGSTARSSGSTAPASPRPRCARRSEPSNTTSASGNSETPSIPTSRQPARPRSRRARGGGLDGQQVRQHRARVPVEMPETALAVLPRGAPRNPGEHERDRRLGDRGSAAAAASTSEVAAT